MSLAVIAFIIAATHPLASASETIEGAPLQLGEGEQRLMTFMGLQKYALNSPHVRATASPSDPKNSLLIRGLGAGLADLWVWKADGSIEHRPIHVRKWKDAEGKPSPLDQALNRLSEVEVIPTGSEDKEGDLRAGYVLRGEIYSEHEAARVRAIRDGFASRVKDETMPSEKLYLEGRRKLDAWIASLPPKTDVSLQTDLATREMTLVGSAISPAQSRILTAKARSLYPLVDARFDSLPDANPTIHFKVYLLELRKSMLRQLGFDWSSSNLRALQVNSWGIREALGIEATIQHLESEGGGRLLSQPELVVRAPGEAELLAGGEIPIETHNQYQSDVSWKNYGLILRLKVAQATRRLVRVDIHTEVSHLDKSVKIGKIPGLQTNRMRTQVDATFGSPLLLSGLLQQSMRENAKGLPFLKDIPILGLLFSSREYQEDRSELVAILFPSREVPDAPMGAIEKNLPLGAIPFPRDWTSPQQEMQLRAHPDYPWNAFKADAPAKDGAQASAKGSAGSTKEIPL